MVKTFNQWLKLINNCDVANFVDLMKSLDAMLDKLGQVNCRLDSIRDTLNDNGIIRAVSTVEQVPCSFEVATDANSSSHSDFIGWESLRRFIYSSV